ncbi:HD domain-containing protein [Motilimonas sp. 1_MG-2023]|uniref:HD domain-containing protein n=1 Tax=Motilimonas sp. 1_MG-2023 TaxID=3062672 RepID=UPI0026E17C5A|nr:HD domain-containing protein [Motilimonas sp. 1_MG-2023]MDO6524845.1 HD domain-containing protein [Motilimonas sp. 1_MG-2023]
MIQQIEQVLSFIMEIEKLKNVHRKTKPVGLTRYENSAEHSWHVCLSALMLQQYANEPVNIDRVIKMLLIHDLGEIDAGDTIIYASETPENKALELAGIRRMMALLPEGQGEQYIEHWREFEAGESNDAKFAKAIDRVPPLLHNLHGEGHSWRDNKVTKEQVFKVNSRIAKGSEPLWQVLEEKLQGAIDDGLLK